MKDFCQDSGATSSFQRFLLTGLNVGIEICVCMHVCMHACMYVCICMYIYIYILWSFRGIVGCWLLSCNACIRFTTWAAVCSFYVRVGGDSMDLQRVRTRNLGLGYVGLFRGLAA